MRWVLVSNTTLMRVASSQLGAASRWPEIARLNRIVDPFIRAPTLLLIPDPATPTTGGVPQ